VPTIGPAGKSNRGALWWRRCSGRMIARAAMPGGLWLPSRAGVVC